MKTKNILRIAIVSEWIFIVLSIVFASLLEDTLPNLLREWIRQENEADITNADIIITSLLAIPFLILYFVGSIGLLFLQNWAKWLYLIPLISRNLIPLIALTFGRFILGPSVENGIEEVFEDLSGICSGIVLALVVFTDVLNNKAEQSPPSDVASAPPDEA
jgi:hypothetical protein